MFTFKTEGFFISANIRYVCRGKTILLNEVCHVRTFNIALKFGFRYSDQPEKGTITDESTATHLTETNIQGECTKF